MFKQFVREGYCMPIELPMHLKQLEALPSALDIIRYLANHPLGAADPEEICADLNISDIRFRKAMRRLVTNNYMQMRSDQKYELVRKGISSAEELAAYDAEAPDNSGLALGMVAREMVVALPRQLATGQTVTAYVGFKPHDGTGFETAADVVLRLEAVHGYLNTTDEMVRLDKRSYRKAIDITPENYDQLRLKIKVFQLSDDGEDLHDCGGIYVDVDVVEDHPIPNMIAYNADIQFKAY
jgi:hypothetical protein